MISLSDWDMATDGKASDWQKHSEFEKLSSVIKKDGLDISAIELLHIGFTYMERYVEIPPLKESERLECIDSIVRHARGLRMDMKALGLPGDTLTYLTDRDIEMQYGDLFQAYDVGPPQTTWRRFLNKRMFRNYYAPVSALLAGLSDKKLLNDAAPESILTKTVNAEFRYTIRGLAIYLHNGFECGFVNGILLCSGRILFPDKDINRDTIHSALRDFKI